MIATSERTEYAFAVGRVRAQETTLLDRPRYDRLVRAPDPAAFRAALADSFYGRFLSETNGMDEVYARAAAESFDFLARYCLDAWVLDVFRLRADIHNLKLLFRIRAGAADDAAFLDFGILSRPGLEALLAGEAEDTRYKAPDARLEEVAALVRTLRPAVGELARSADESRTPDQGDSASSVPEQVDARLDRLEQELVLERVRDSAYLSGWRELYADVENLRTFARVRAAGLGGAALGQAFLPGGTLTIRLLRELLPAEQDGIAARFRMSRFRRLVDEGMAEVVGHRSFLRMERLGRELALEHVRLARYATFGYEPLVAFFLLRENEITNLRQLAAAKAAGLDESECREMVAYVE